MDILNAVIKLSPLVSIVIIAYAYVDISRKLDKLSKNIKKIEKEFILDDDDEDFAQRFTSEESDFVSSCSSTSSNSSSPKEERRSKRECDALPKGESEGLTKGACDALPDLVSSSTPDVSSDEDDDHIDKEEEIDILNEFKYYEGKSLDEVAKYAASSGYTLRIIETDGKKTKYTETKYNPNILNVAVKEVETEGGTSYNIIVTKFIKLG